ncbi:MAG: clostripain-related cysteine peptidase [Oligoflexia bacterium]|nr:clostripain-related cysteine peptidase [Oligoflexia bacterium]
MLKIFNKLALAMFIFTLSSMSLAAEKEWTMLTFMNGHNNLDSYGAKDLNEMETVGSTDKINVVVQWASLGSTQTKRVYVHQDNQPGIVTSPIVESLPRVDMGDYKNLIEFVRWGVMNYPAKKYFINVWNHGSGWHVNANPLFQLFKGLGLTGFEAASFSPSDISWDDLTGNFISTTQLGLAINESAKIIGHKVDIYGSDACLMAMPEVSTEMADSVHMYVGSEDTEPGPGWEYGSFLKTWSALPDMSPFYVSKALTDTYVASYTNGPQGNLAVTFSALDLTKTPALLLAMKGLSAGLIALPNAAKLKVKTVIGLTQAFYFSDSGDGLDFVKHLEQANIESMRPGILSSARNALTGFIAYNKGSPSFSKATGAAMWIPKKISTFDLYWARYQKLKFQQETQWGNAMQSVLMAQ